MNNILLIAALSLLTSWGAVAAQTQKGTPPAKSTAGAKPTPMKSVNEGVYTTAQAERGASIFKTSCTACHDTARFTGHDFVSGWVGKPIHELYETIHSTMPEDKPGSLTRQQYADVIAFFLRLNGYPAGKVELPTADASLKSIRFEKRATK
jgi:S-disulfanyl-L-cysteine oxidoreductase SoxD